MSSGIENVTVTELRGNNAPPAPIDQCAIVVATSSTGAVGFSGVLYSNPQSINNDYGYGPGPTAVQYLIEEYGIPVGFYRTPSSTPGTAGVTSTAAILGSAGASAAIGGTPYDDYEPWYQVQGTAALGTLINIKWSLDNGRTQSPQVNLGAALTYGIPNSGVVITFGASGQTYAAGDYASCATTAPKWAASDLDTAGLPSGQIAQSTYDMAHLYLAGPASSSEAGHVTTMLNNLRSVGKIVNAVIHTTGPTVGQSEAAWAVSVASDYSAFSDDRIEKIEGHKTRVIDPFTAQQWFRTWAYAYFARMVANERNTWTGSPDDGGFTDPNSGSALIQLYDSNGNLIGHDEGPSGNVTGLSYAAELGNTFTCLMRGQTQQSRKLCYTTVPWVCFTSGGRVFTMMQRNVANAIERVALSVSFAALGGTSFYETDPTTNVSTLLPGSFNAIHNVIFSALTGDEFSSDIENSDDDDPVTGLVRPNPVVSVAAGNLVTISVYLAPKIADKIIGIGLIYAAQ